MAAYAEPAELSVDAVLAAPAGIELPRVCGVCGAAGSAGFAAALHRPAAGVGLVGGCLVARASCGACSATSAEVRSTGGVPAQGTRLRQVEGWEQGQMDRWLCGRGRWHLLPRCPLSTRMPAGRLAYAVLCCMPPASISCRPPCPPPPAPLLLQAARRGPRRPRACRAAVCLRLPGCARGGAGPEHRV